MKDEGRFNMIDCTDDALSIVKLNKHIDKYVIPPKEMGIKLPDCLFRRRAAQNVVNVRKRLFNQLHIYINYVTVSLMSVRGYSVFKRKL